MRRFKIARAAAAAVILLFSAAAMDAWEGRAHLEEHKPNTDNAPKWVLLGLDAALTGAAAALAIDSHNYAREYEAKYKEINGTTPENYRILFSMKNKLEEKNAAAAITGVLAACFITYTIADIFFIREVFPDGFNFSYSPKGKLEISAVW
ncbi:MAG TPA: hypothetical protein ENN43_04130 [bacterium]|nr:hypothetical protein [bacterium]